MNGENIEVEVSHIEPKVQSEGYWIGERVVEIKLGEGTTLPIPELAIETAKELNGMGAYSILFTSEDKHVDWDVVLEFMEFMHEHYKISINTSGEEIIPDEFLDKRRTFITLQPSLEEGFDFTTFERNTLKVTKNEYWNFQISFEVSSSDEIENALDMLSRMVTPKNLTVVLSPPKCESVDEHLELLENIRDYCSDNEMSPTYDVRVLPKLNEIIPPR